MSKLNLKVIDMETQILEFSKAVILIDPFSNTLPIANQHSLRE